MAVGKDRETCPYRNSTIINGPNSSANARNTYNIQHFYCVFHSGTFCVTTYLPTDREKSRDSGFCDPESLLYISQLAFPTSASPFQRRSPLSSGDHLLQQLLTVLSSFGVNVAGLLSASRESRLAELLLCPPIWRQPMITGRIRRNGSWPVTTRCCGGSNRKK